MYFPAGWYHEVAALSDSISINFSFMPVRWSDVLLNATQMLMWQSPHLRAPALLQNESLVSQAEKCLRSTQLALNALTIEALLPRAVSEGKMRGHEHKLELWRPQMVDTDERSAVTRSPLSFAYIIDVHENPTLIVEHLFGNDANHRPLFWCSCRLVKALESRTNGLCKIKCGEVLHGEQYSDDSVRKVIAFLKWCGFLLPCSPA